MPTAPRKIALFGGTFDPPHLGHLALADEAVAKIGLDRVFFIPCRRSPHKDADSAATPEQRCEMLRLSLAGRDWARISRIELERPEPSFSWQTVESFSEEFPHAGLYWILGLDQWEVIDTWARPDILRDQVTFVVFPRNSGKPGDREGYRACFLERTHPASATQVRALLETGGDATALVHPAVLQFIEDNGIYRKRG